VTPLALGALLYLIVFGSVVAFTAYSWLVEREGPSRALSFTYVNPLVAVLLGALLLHEPLTARIAAAAVAIVAAVVLIVGGTAAAPPTPTASPTPPGRRARTRDGHARIPAGGHP
jgi:drug/metabolite transporter (DMT)-like permease